MRSHDFDADGVADLFIPKPEHLAVSEAPREVSVVFGAVGEREDAKLTAYRDSGFSFRNEVLRFDVGDFNGDGAGDIIVPVPDDGIVASRSHVFFGSPTIDGLVDPEALDGTNGFTIFDTLSTEGTVSAAQNAGDFNGDGIDDLVVASVSSLAFVYGGDSLARSIDTLDLDGNNGVWVGRQSSSRRSSFSTSIGDINGDGRDDLFWHGVNKVLLGVPENDGHVSINELSEEFLMQSRQLGTLVGVGDLNGDGFDDVLNLGSGGRTSILFGSKEGVMPSQENTTLAAESWLTPGGVGFGDINGDGLADVIITDETPPQDDIDGIVIFRPGRAYVLYGSRDGYPDHIDLQTYLDGKTGFIIEGFHGEDHFGSGLAVGDFNGDETDDIAVSAWWAQVPFGIDSGALHVIYGRETEVTGVGAVNSTTRLVPGEVATYVVESVSGNATFTVSIPNGVDADPTNNSVSISIGSAITGDANGDGSTDFQDFLILANNFGKEDAVFAEGDFDGDGRVSFLDFLVLANDFGRSTV